MANREIHDCEIISEIGVGGMAVIHKAVQNSLNREVAIKELKKEYATDSQIVARFVREATALAALQHQNIVHIYDFVQKDGVFCMLMEYVEGIDLFDLLDRVGRVPPTVATIIAHGVCAGLEYAHYRNIIQRDIKKSNVILSRKGEIKLMDFGIARDENLGDLTRPGTSLGTPAYMSPEQIMGVKIDFRTDIFSLGVVLYQLLTGAKPFDEGGGMSIMHKILNGKFTRPRRLLPDIPRSLEAIVLRCMAKEPNHRYASTGDLRRELEAYLLKRLRMHRSARLVVYMHHNGLLDRDEAVNFVEEKSLQDPELVREDAGLPPPLKLSTLAKLQGGLAMLLVVWILLVHFTSGPQRATSGTVTTGPPGALKVVAWPWAEIYIDGAYVETTPVDRSFSLAPGIHEVTLKNPHFKTKIQRVLIEPARTQTLKARLEGGPKGSP